MTVHRAIAIVGLGATLPGARDVASFWANIKGGRASIGEVDPRRWDPALYWHPDRSAPDKTYSKIGGWVEDYEWDPLAWRLPIPPKVAQAMDRTQKWAITCARQALHDHGYPEKAINRQRTAVILGNAMAGDQHYLTAMRVYQPEYAAELATTPSFSSLPPSTRSAILQEFREGVQHRFPDITEDTMPGELANIIAGRVAAVFDLHGPNYITDAACASAMAALNAAIEGLEEEDYDLVLTGGVDANMSASTFVKFSKIGALSATGSRPYADGADGFVMGEGAAVFLLKRLADAERDGDRIYAVIRGMGGASDGKGKGITAPNPAGQQAAILNAWAHAGETPASATMIEGHGTSTRVGDLVEFESLNAVFGGQGLLPGSIALGSVKSNIGHLKGAAGAAGILKVALALHEKVIPPSAGFSAPNPRIDFAGSPFWVPTAAQPWERTVDGVRRVGVSAFGFGGTNFHAVLEEYIPGRIAARALEARPPAERAAPKAPLRGLLVVGGKDEAEIATRLAPIVERARRGEADPPQAPSELDLRAATRLSIDYGNANELAALGGAALRSLGQPGQEGAWKALRGRGVFLGRGAAGEVAFLYTGQGSQYVGMLAELARTEPAVARVFETADRVMEPLIGQKLSPLVFAEPTDEAEARLRRTEITQPAVLTVDIALATLLGQYGITPDMVMGHSLGEYGALVAAHVLSFEDALRAVSARGAEMAKVSVEDNGLMAAVFGPVEVIRHLLEEVHGYVVVANHNSDQQVVIGGTTAAVREALEMCSARGITARLLPVSHAFHTSIVAPASEPLKRVLRGFEVEPPEIPLVGNVEGSFYPSGEGVRERIVDLLGRQVASPVQFVKGLRTLHEAGARVYVEVGPKRALAGMAEDVLAPRGDVCVTSTNHPRQGDVASFNRALAALYAAGLGVGRPAPRARELIKPAAPPEPRIEAARAPPPPPPPVAAGVDHRLAALGRIFESALQEALPLLGERPDGHPIVVTGAGLGLPGGDRVFAPDNVRRILAGDQRIDSIPQRMRREMADRHVTRLVKEAGGEPHFETIDDPHAVVRLAGRAAAFDLVREFDFPGERAVAFDRVTALGIAAGLDALRDAGIPLVMRYKATTTGGRLPDRWMLPESMRDDTGVVFGSAFPGYDALVDEVERYHEDRGRRERIALLRELLGRAEGTMRRELERRLHELEAEAQARAYGLDRRFLFRILSMGHAQFAEYVGARGPNTQVNAACASATQALGIAEDWIRAGRCRRVVVISADDASSDRLMPWIGSGFLASGAAATDELVEDAAVPFDRRRHGMIVGMGAGALVVERADAARERGLRPIAELLGVSVANSAFHGTRLDVGHIAGIMEGLVSRVEGRAGLRREEIAPHLVFMSHETYTPARGGSAQAEIESLRRVFGKNADQVVIANTKGFTGHAMGAGIEDVVAVKVLETGVVPPVANLKEPDPELGDLTLSRGGAYDVRYALRLAAGFGSQIAMSLLRAVPSPGGELPAADQLGYAGRIEDPQRWTSWLRAASGYAEPRVELAGGSLRVAHEGPPDVGILGRAPKARAEKAPPEAEKVEKGGGASRGAGAGEARELRRPERPSAAALRDEAQAEDLGAAVLEIVAAQTGYPKDLLAMDLDLEADLGVDTVKQAEVFAAVRARWGIPRDEGLKLRDYPTLGHVVAFVKARAPAGAAGGAPRPEGPAKQGEPAAERTASSPAPSPAPSPAAGPAGGHDDIEARVLEIVAAQTGYPRDLLALDLDLEADLGIDTVKQAEMFAAVRKEWDIPRDEALKLRDYPTLGHVVGFVRARAPGGPGPGPAGGPGPAPAGGPGPGPAAGPAPRGSFPRRIPVPQLRPPLDACLPTGLALAGARIIVALDESGVGAALVRRLQERGATVLAAPAAAVPEWLGGWLAEGPVQGLYWLPALDLAGDVYALGAAELDAALHRRVHSLFRTLRALGPDFGAAGHFFLAATRLGGLFGLEGPIPDPLGGAVAGFTKALRRERPGLLAKVVDFGAGRKTAALADRLLAETLADPGVVEVGSFQDLRWTLGLAEAEAQGAGLALGPDTVWVVTGAAGSITSAIVADLARGGGDFHLLDLIAEPDPADPDLAAFTADRDGLRGRLAERLRARGERATPAAVERLLAGIERRVAARAAMAAVRAAGGRATWHQVDLLDPAALGRVAATLGALPKADVLIHAAGIEISRNIQDKSPEEFDRVFGIKALGWLGLVRALPGLRAAVAFSSIAGRFGNAGQSDYAAANDLLCKLAAHLGQARPGVRGIALDWTGWGGIGMATRGSIPKILEAAGIDLLPPELGIPVTRRELEAATTGEVLVAGRLGAMTAPLHPEGGLGELWTALGRARIDAEGLELRLRLQAEAPFLDHHRIEGTPVLPGVMGVEAFVEAATLAAPGWRAIAVEELSFGAPLKLYRDEEREASVRLRVRPEGEELIAACVLTSSRGTAVGEQRVEHFRGRVRLARTAPTPTRVELPEPGPTLGPEAIYAVYFHGPAFRVIEAAGPAGDGVLARMPASLPPSMPEPSRAGPRQLEAVFQAAGLGAIGREGRMGLPTSVRRIRLVDPAPDAEGGLLVLARPGAAGWDAVVADAEGRVRMEVEGYATVDLGPVEPAKLAPFARFG